MVSVALIQVLLSFIIGVWISARFTDSPFVKFFGRNDWFVGSFLILLGWFNYISYQTDYLKNLNLVLIVIGIILVLFSIVDIKNR